MKETIVTQGTPSESEKGIQPSKWEKIFANMYLTQDMYSYNLKNALW